MIATNVVKERTKKITHRGRVGFLDTRNKLKKNSHYSINIRWISNEQILKEGDAGESIFDPDAPNQQQIGSLGSSDSKDGQNLADADDPSVRADGQGVNQGKVEEISGLSDGEDAVETRREVN